ncbi:MAG TPA: LemA family protein [Thermoanaerobaculia bacterium]|mgnify:CR=1 FL=1|nr:LemA family protein [Thermoanaerobaculia bacterium]HUM29620.1 LemA family protein [Thermoanaerobaculia bacterium]HXK67271.1 LemA family protein [Thermoanaerobaculia bacterium]
MFAAFIVILILAVGIVFWLIGIFNALVRLRNQVKNSWSQIDVQLKRRHDLIPNLVETVKGYMHHERETLEAVTKARQQAISVTDSVADRARMENALSQTLRSLFAVAENYPDLKANQNFLALQEELTSTENKISFARQFYNDSVLQYNNKTEMFPSNIVAGMFNFTRSEFFEVEDAAEREAPKVAF